MKLKFYKTIILTFVFLTTTAQVQTFKGKQYILNNGKYEMLNISDLQYYPIIENTITIKFKTSTSPSQIQSIENQNNLIRLRKAETGWYDYQIVNNLNLFQKANFFINNSIIEDVEIPKLGKYVISPNDNSYSNQWYLNQSSGINIDIENAWNITTGNTNIIVGILDSGTDWSHLDFGLGFDNFQNVYLNPNEDAWSNPNNPSTGNGIDDDGNGYIDDWKGWDFNNNNNDSRGPFYHGTHVAGIIGAKSNNNEGMAGIAGGWNSEGSKLLLCGVGDFGPDASILDDAILYAAQMGVKVIQLSLTAPQSTAIDDALEMAYNDYGVTIICSSGNAGNSSSVGYPSSNQYVISVGATTETDSKANFSNHGSNLLISAPGTNIYSLRIGNQYGSGDGTSYAAPIVSGVVALMYSVNPCLTNQQIENILKSTADKVGGYNYNWDSSNPGHSLELGYGKVNAYAAVQMAQSMASPDLDLYIKDSPNDDGTEPNTVTQHMWTSQDIWVRKNNDGGLIHQNPEYKSNGNPNFINVRVINKSCVTSTGNETLTLNWAKANTALAWPQYWDGSINDGSPDNPNLPPNATGDPLGGVLNSVTIPILQGGEEAIVVIPWEVPNPDYYLDNDNPWHFCLLARIDSPDDPIGTFTSNPNIMVRNNNNQAWKNITVVDLIADATSASVMVANPSDTPRTFFLELQKQVNEGGKAIFEEAEVTLTMDDVLFDAWERGGKIAQELDPTIEEKRKLVKGDNVILDDIAFEANEMGLLTLDFNFLTEELTEKDEYIYHVVQKDANTGEVIGGETYVIRKDTRPAFIADAGGDKEVDLNETITISAEDINEPAVYNWYDKDGNLIYQGKDLTVTADVVKEYKLEVIATTDGFKDYTDVEVKFKPNVIESISPNPASNNITVNYNINDASSSYLMVIGYYGSSTSNNYILDNNLQQTQINVSSYPVGYYTVALVCNGEIVDAKTLIKQ